MQITRSRFFTPAVAVAFGFAMLVAQWIGGDARNGLLSLAIMTGFGLLIVLGGGSETVRGLRGDGRDERFSAMDIRATAFAGSFLIAVILIAFLVDIARGNDGAPYNWLGAITAIAYLAAILTLRVRG
jgi:undecaprenyl pyrophosphate phosphatase UppP